MYALQFHTQLTSEKWQSFSTSKQLLMVGNELQRAINKAADSPAAMLCFERAFELIDLTVEATTNRSQRKELLRMRELLAREYVSQAATPSNIQSLLRALVTLDADSCRLGLY
ncbi:MAG: hypothetical protein WCP97_04060 [bacterium]